MHSSSQFIDEQCHEKICFLHVQKQRCRSCQKRACVDNIHVLNFKSRQIVDRSKQMQMTQPFESVKKCFSQYNYSVFCSVINPGDSFSHDVALFLNSKVR